MSGYERPSRADQDSPRRGKLSFWAMLSRPQEHGPGETLVSPGFGTQAEMAEWVRTHSKDFSEVCAYRHEPDGRDVALRAADPPADPARVGEILAKLRTRGAA